jgi:non-heme chloroperoxidase
MIFSALSENQLIMNYIKSKDVTGKEVHIHYEDLGEGQPVVLIHGWPLNLDMWEYQVSELLSHGLRVISYDRRGFGKSGRPVSGYDYDTLTDDLKAVLDGLDLQNVILIGFSMGGGEVVRYFSRHGGARVAKAVLISSVTPFMLKTQDNPEGTDQSVFDDMAEKMKNDRVGFLDSFGKQFFGVSVMNHPISTPLLDHYRTLEALASPIATLECAKSFATTDFRKDMGAVNVPTLIIHGDEDKTVPIEAAGNQSEKMIGNSVYIVYEGAPHGLWYTHRKQLNEDLLRFIEEPVSKRTDERSYAF